MRASGIARVVVSDFRFYTSMQNWIRGLFIAANQEFEIVQFSKVSYDPTLVASVCQATILRSAQASQRPRCMVNQTCPRHEVPVYGIMMWYVEHGARGAWCAVCAVRGARCVACVVYVVRGA